MITEKLKLSLAAILLALALDLSASVSPSGTLPIMHINTEDSRPIVDKVTKIPAGLWIEIPQLCEDPDFALASSEAPVTLEIRGRGNASWTQDKKPYKLKFTKKTAILGMPKHKHFVLLPCYYGFHDYMGQTLGKDLAGMTGLGWGPRHQPVELVLNNEYLGLYTFMESVKIDENRLDIFEQEELNTDPETIPYGWLVEIDNYPDEYQIKVPEGPFTMQVTHHSPEELSDVQRQWLIDEFTAINATIYGDDPERWVEHIEPASMARYFIIRELLTDTDGFNGSMYMHKDKDGDGLWHMGPIWDNSFYGWHTPEDWTMNLLPDYARWKILPAIFYTKAFQNAFIEEWDKFYPQMPRVTEMILETYAHIAAADQIDSELWGHKPANEAYVENIAAMIAAKAEWMEANKHYPLVPSGIISPYMPDAVSAVKWYTTSGLCIDQPSAAGIYIKAVRNADGSVSSTKTVVR